jgi:hypothetical protein
MDTRDVIFVLHLTLMLMSFNVKCHHYRPSATSTTAHNGEYEAPEVEFEREITTKYNTTSSTSTPETTEITNGETTTAFTTTRVTTTVENSQSEHYVSETPRKTFVTSTRANIASTTTKKIFESSTRANHVTEVSRKTPIANPRWFNRTNSIVPIRTPVKDKPPMNKYREIQVVKQKKILPLRDISFNKLNSNPSRGDVQHSFISGPDWNNIFKSPKTNISNRISSKDITVQLNSLNHLQEISFAQRWGDVTPQNTNVLFSFGVGRESLSNKNKVNQKPITVWPDKKFKPSKKIKDDKQGIQFRLSDVLSNTKNTKLFSFKENVAPKEPKFQYERPNSISPPVKTIFRFGSFVDAPLSQRGQLFNLSSGSYIKKNIQKRLQENNSIFSTNVFKPQSLNNRKADTKYIPRKNSDLNRMSDKLHQTRNLGRTIKNRVKLNVVKTLFDIDHVTDIIPYLMMGSAVP